MIIGNDWGMTSHEDKYNLTNYKKRRMEIEAKAKFATLAGKYAIVKNLGVGFNSK